MRHFEQRLRPLSLGLTYLPVVVALDEKRAMLQKELVELARAKRAFRKSWTKQ